ncbi:MAG TPA: hypothetical protein VJ838_12005 [Gaiellaceae bacterium]|nr:hypothetical protein [Gaiellaceae bacterium]
MLRGLTAGIAVALFAAGAALAASPSKEKIARTAAGNAQAKAEVVRKADVGSGWKGGYRKPDLSSSMPCTTYHPKQSDLVLIGAAESRFSRPALEVDSEAQVLRSPAMVRRDWQRTILDSRVMPCLRQGFIQALGSHAKLVSFGVIAFPHVAPLTRAIRLVANVTTQFGPVPLEIDFVAVGSGRNELTLTLSGPTVAGSTLHATELRLARVVAGRAGP